MTIRRLTPRRILATTGAAIAFGLLLSVAIRPTADADHHEQPPSVEASDVLGGHEFDPPPRMGGRPDRPGSPGEARLNRRDGMGERGSGPVELTEDQVEEAIALMIELDPSIAPRIEQLRAERPELLRRAVSRRFPRLGYMLKLKEKRPELYALRVRDIQLENLSHEQARVLAALPADDPGVGAARATLRATLEDHFVVRQDVRRGELAALRDKIAEMETKLVDDAARREALVQQRLDQLEADPPPPAGKRGVDDGERRRGQRGERGD